MAVWKKGHYIPALQNSISPPQRVGWKEKKTGKRNTVKVIIVIKVKCIGGLNIQNMIRFG